MKVQANDLTDRVFQHVNVSILTETFVKNNEPQMTALNFDFVIRFQRNEKINTGVAIYQNVVDRNHIITPHLDIKFLY